MMKLVFKLVELQVIRYIFSGGSAAVTNLTVLFLLVHFFKVWYLLAAVVSYLVAIYVSFMMQKFFTFNDYAKDKIRQQLIFYFAIQIFNLAINTLLMYIAVDIFNIHYLISQIIAGVIIAIYSFFIYKNIAFKPNSIYKKESNSVFCLSCGKSENKNWGNKNGYNLAQCDHCGLIFVSPIPNESEDIYNKSYFAGGEEFGYVDYDRDKEPMKHTFELYLDNMEHVLKRKGKLLDVGCATGYFMDIAKKRGWEVEGVEISEYAVGLGKSKGLIIHQGTLDNINLPEKSFDAITLLDVVEHLKDPRSVMVKAKKLLKEDGVVVVATPDSGSLWARIFGLSWHLVVPPEHLFLFNRKNFSNLLDSIKMNPVLVVNLGKHFTLPYIFQTLYHWQGLSIWNIFSRFTNKGSLIKFKIPINLHDTFFMIAKNQ